VLVAWDGSSGSLLASVDGAAFQPLFPGGVAPGPVVGAGLFPAVSGIHGCRVRVNLGSRPWRHAPPDGFLPWAQAAPLGQMDSLQVPLPPSPLHLSREAAGPMRRVDGCGAGRGGAGAAGGI
jgi:hypothetical protein